MLEKLEAYYRENGILATEFSCKLKNHCSENCPSFTGPKSAYVGTGYERHELPRLLFLSLDSGSAEEVDIERLPQAVRKQEEVDRYISGLRKNRHWYRTHELAWYILKQFKPELLLTEAKHYFAHANSAKCCMNNPGNKKANAVLFRNCARYLNDELRILSPQIIVTQGNEARDAIRTLAPKPLEYFDEFASSIVLHDLPVFWLHTYHPNNYGVFNRHRNFNKETQMADGWLRHSSQIYEFLRENA